MNWNQIVGISRLLIPGIIGSLALTHVITDSTATNLTAFLLSIFGSVAWSGVSNTTLNLSKAVSATNGVQVVVDHNAPMELQLAAADRADRSLKDIVTAPSMPTSPLMRKITP